MNQVALHQDACTDLYFSMFCQRVERLTGIDLGDYRGAQLKRRLQSIMARAGAVNLAVYARMLEHDPQRLREFCDYLTINVSEFFRDPDHFSILGDRILPELLASTQRLNLWSAGCANGAEPYSLAILLKELSVGSRHRLLATDIDDRSLHRAREGRDYRQQDVRNVPVPLLHKYFRQHDGRYSVVEGIRKQPIFKKHNLLRDPFEEGFDLIVCRNVVIYFTAEARERLFRRFSASLKPGGVLFVGTTEIIQNCHRFGLESLQPSFYRRVP
ncbi:MAG: CheR family methyltransferase [Chloroflexota bacterium]